MNPDAQQIDGPAPGNGAETRQDFDELERRNSELEREVARLVASNRALTECEERLRLAVETEVAKSERLEEENVRLREDFSDLFDEAPIPYVHEGLDTRFIRANRAALQVLGVRPDEIAETVGSRLVADTPEMQVVLSEALELFAQGKGFSGVLLELRRKDDGRPVWVHWWSRPDVARGYTRTMFIDVTERLLLERAKAALEFTLKSGQVGDWDLDLTHDTSRRSLRHDQCFGYQEAIPEADWGVAKMLRHVHPEDRAQVESGFRRAVENLRDWEAEFRVVWTDGSVHWLMVRGSIYGKCDGIVTRMLGIVMDVTERKQSEEALRETKAVLEFTLESAEVGDWDLDLVTDTSRRSLRHDQCFGYDEPIPDEAWGVEAFSQHVHPDDRERVASSLRRAAKELLDWDSEFRVVWPDQSVHWLAAQGSIYRTQEGKATRMLGTVKDITDRKRAEEALQSSERLARGQVEALTRTLDALAKESTPDRLVEHVLRTLTEQFGAHSSSVWRRDEGSDLIGFEFAFEEGRIVTRADSRFAGIDLWLPMEDFWPWPEVFRSGRPSVIEDIRTVQPFALRDRLLPLGIVTVLLIPMSVLGRLEGAIGLRFTRPRAFRPEELELAQALANQAMLVTQLTRLSALSRESAVLEERNRMARDIHDTLAQGLTGVIVQLEALGEASSRGLTTRAAEHLERAGDLARESLQEARRSVRALRPQALEDHDLCEALEGMIRSTTEHTGLNAQFIWQGARREVPADWDKNILRIAQEALTNVLRHAQASEFEAHLIFEHQQLLLTLHDDGRGFDPAQSFDGFGLIGMRERVKEMGGRLSIVSSSGAGTTVSMVLPLTDSPDEL